jgi:hypothetical protein
MNLVARNDRSKVYKACDAIWGAQSIIDDIIFLLSMLLASSIVYFLKIPWENDTGVGTGLEVADEKG